MTGTLPFAGVRVLDLTQIYNGPYATFLMAAGGAEVIKVEPPGGEFLRRRDGTSGAFLPFAMLNANKGSVTLNLKTLQGRELFLKMVESADVVAENYAPGVMARLGLGYEDLRARNPRIIMASGSGYGQDGAYRNYMAMDLTVQAMSGVMSVTGYPDGSPTKSGAALCDFFGGVHLYGAISAALFRRERVGEGAWLDISMLEAVYPTMASNMGMLYGPDADRNPRTGNRHGGLSLCPYNVYPAQDGHIAIICNNDRHWQGLALAMKRSDLIDDPRYATNKARVGIMDEVDDLVGAFTQNYPRAALAEMLQNEFRVPSAPVRTLGEVMSDPALHDRGSLLNIDHPVYGEITVPRAAIRFADTPNVAYEPSPVCGRDNESFYQSLGLDAEQRGALREQGVI